MWACYNAYIIMDHYNTHKKPNKRTRTFGKFIEQICISLVGTHRKTTKAIPRGFNLCLCLPGPVPPFFLFEVIREEKYLKIVLTL